MGEENYSPDYFKMDLADAQGAAKAAKNMADRRFKRFEADVQEVIDGGRYDKDNYKTVKDLKKNIEENIDRYEDTLTQLEGVYAAKPTKYGVEMDELTTTLKSLHREEAH